MGHLLVLIQTTPVTEHGLSVGEIKTIDRMNFKIVEKLIKPQVTQALSKHVEQSEGTILYLKLINYVVSSFMEPHLTVLGRVRRIWYAIFFLRYWRTWLARARLSLADFYITHNAEFCVELNGHELLQIIRYCRDEGCPEAFLATFFHSQWNEAFFRKIRSMGSTFSTVVNFSIGEFLQRVKRAEFLIESDVQLEHKMNKQQKQRDIHVPLAMPSDEEIGQVIEVARKEAEKDLASVGVTCNAPPTCHIAPSKIVFDPKQSTPDIDNDSDSEESSEDCFCINMSELFPNINYDAEFKDCTNEYGKFDGQFDSNWIFFSSIVL